MRLTIAYSKIKKRNLVLINNGTHQRETLSQRPIRQKKVVNSKFKFCSWNNCCILRTHLTPKPKSKP